MQKLALPRTDLVVSPACLGTRTCARACAPTLRLGAEELAALRSA
jgi:hypothetical protein